MSTSHDTDASRATADAAHAFDPVPLLAEELSLPRGGVAAIVRLLAEGATVPFIARYRKEATGGLDEVAIRNVEERRAYLVELEERRQVVLAEIDKQGKLAPELAAKIRGCKTKSELEDLYLPFKPKRRTRATIARERGLEPLAERIWSQCLDGSPAGEAAAFVDADKGVVDVAAALAGAVDICAERLAELADARRVVREAILRDGRFVVCKQTEHEGKATRFDTYASFEEPFAAMPSHRFLAIRRGESEGVLRVALDLEGEGPVRVLEGLARVEPRSPWAPELRRAAEEAFGRLIAPSVKTEVRIDKKLDADRTAVDVFAQNLRELLLAPPFGGKRVLGIDPGQRTGCKCVVVDGTGKLCDSALINLVMGAEAEGRARRTVADLVRKHGIEAVAIGNGTHGRETQLFVAAVLAAEGLRDVLTVSVSEAGASVYSASDVAREEFPDLDLTVRGAISIARRLQDPLAELVKLDPKSIGVGQYQHDVHQPLLARKLDEVVESCVNSVGVELNTASAPLLARVAGIGPSLAKRIVAHRDASGPFRSRRALADVGGVGPRTFEQAAGFLRVRDGEHPLDGSAVHPERYALVERMAADLGVPVASLVGNPQAVAKIDVARYQSVDVGRFTLDDILAELQKPGRDPRSIFEPPRFRDDVTAIEHLTPGMELEGVVTNVTAFGAFVDVGVHQDGLVHVSKLADRFVKDPAEVVKVGDRICVRVVEVDLERKRISLTARKDEPRPRGGAESRPQAGGAERREGRRDTGGARDARRPAPRGNAPSASGRSFSNNPFAELLRK